MEKFEEFKAEGKTVIAVHHDMNTLLDYFDNVVVVDKTIKAQGNCSEMYTILVSPSTSSSPSTQED